MLWGCLVTSTCADLNLNLESVTMQQPDFPLFSNDKAARSWGCCACHSTNITATVGDENFPQGRGHYRYQCLDCKLYTWFDLEETIKTA
jgi:hypothetical protein